MIKCTLCDREIFDEYFDLNDNTVKRLSEEEVEEGNIVYCMKCLHELGRGEKPDTRNSWMKRLFGGGSNGQNSG